MFFVTDARFRPIRKTQFQQDEKEEEEYFKDDGEDQAAKDAKMKEEMAKFKEMPKRDEEEEDAGMRFKELSKKGKDTGRKDRKPKEEPETDRKFREAEPATGRKEPEGRIKFKLGDTLKPVELVDYGSDEEEKGKEEKKEVGESIGNGQVRERDRDLNGDEPASKRIKVMDEREEFPRTPPVST